MVRIKPLLSVDMETGRIEWFDALPDDAAFVGVIRLSVPLVLPDNQVGECSACGSAVQFRPGLPEGFPKVCLECLPAWVEGLEKPS